MLNLERKLWLKISAVCGVLAPILAFSCILLSIRFAPDFSWTDSALSDLGVMSNPAAILFNSGLIISGILGIVFALGLLSFLNGKSVGRAGTLLFLLDCLALAAIGVFSENTGRIHFYVSVAFFALFPFSMFLMAASFVLTSRNRMAVFTFLVSVFAAAVWVAEFWVRYVPGVAIPETLSGIAASFWVIVTCFIMLRAASRSDK
jgi:hypothetical membrane protein